MKLPSPAELNGFATLIRHDGEIEQHVAFVRAARLIFDETWNLNAHRWNIHLGQLIAVGAFESAALRIADAVLPGRRIEIVRGTRTAGATIHNGSIAHVATVERSLPALAILAAILTALADMTPSQLEEALTPRAVVLIA